MQQQRRMAATMLGLALVVSLGVAILGDDDQASAAASQVDPGVMASMDMTGETCDMGDAGEACDMGDDCDMPAMADGSYDLPDPGDMDGCPMANTDAVAPEEAEELPHGDDPAAWAETDGPDAPAPETAEPAAP